MTLFWESVKSFGSGPWVEEVDHWEWPLKFIPDPYSYAALCIPEHIVSRLCPMNSVRHELNCLAMTSLMSWITAMFQNTLLI